MTILVLHQAVPPTFYKIPPMAQLQRFLLFYKCENFTVTEGLRKLFCINSSCISLLKNSGFHRPVTSLGHQGGRRVFWEESRIFKLCPIILNFVQHIFQGSQKFFSGEFRSWFLTNSVAWIFGVETGVGASKCLEEFLSEFSKLARKMFVRLYQQIFSHKDHKDLFWYDLRK